MKPKRRLFIILSKYKRRFTGNQDDKYDIDLNISKTKLQ